VVGALCHVICRFVDYRFVLDDEGRVAYLGFLAASLGNTDWRLISYALMSSHIHLGMIMGADPLSAWAHRLNQRFANWINRKLRGAKSKVLGAVFADRPSTKPICPSRTRFLLAYHHRNPMSAGVVDDVAQSTWTSHRAYVGLDTPPLGLEVDLGLRHAGFARTPEGRREFHAFVSRTSVGVEELFDSPNVPSVLEDSRVSPLPDAHLVIRLAARVCEQPIEDVRNGSRRRAIAQVRRVALVVWLTRGGTTARMAAALGISAPGASQLLNRNHDTASVERLAAEVRRRICQLES